MNIRLHKQHIAGIIISTSFLAAAFMLVGASSPTNAQSVLGPFVYISDFNAGKQQIIDNSTDTVSGNIGVGSGPYGSAYNSVTGKLYVANSGVGANTISVIDPVTNTVISTINVGFRVWQVDANPVTNRVYVTLIDNQAVRVYDGSTNALLATVILATGARPFGISVNPNTNKIYVGDLNGGVSVIDGATNAVIKGLAGSAARGVRVNPSTNKIYYANAGASTVSVVDGLTDTVVKNITVGNGPAFPGVDTTTNKIYVPNYTGGSLSVIDGNTDTITATITGLGGSPNAVAIQPSLNKAYVAVDNTNTVKVISTLTNTVLSTITVTGGGGRMLYATAIANLTTPVCGNNVVESGEQCDDGNTASGDGCSSTCQIERQCVNSPAQMVSWWPGDGNTNDITDGNQGTLQGGATFGAGMVGQAFKFDGIDDRVSVADAANLQPQQFTLDVWVYLNAAGENACVVCKQYGNSFLDSYALYTQSGALKGAITNGASTFDLGSGVIVPVNQWAHLAMTWDGSTIRLYLNGNLVKSQAYAAGTLAYDANPLLLGADDNGVNSFVFLMNGLVDEAEIFSRALTQVEIQSIYNADSAGKCKVASDTTAPDTAIISNPSNPSNNSSASFSFTSTESGSTFECGLDGGAFAACISPKSYAGLADGSHAFQVRAKDAAGNTDATPASFTWIVDTVAPVSTINVTPAMPNGENGWYNTDAPYAITATDSGGSGVAETLGCADTTNNCAPAAGGASGTLTAEGDNYIRFQSRDIAGNLESIKVQLVKIDKTKPAVALNSLLAFDGDGFVNLVWSATDGASGVSEARLYRNGTFIHASLNSSGSFVDDRSLVANDGQTFAYTARAKDYAGQLNDSAAQSTTVDLSPPSVPGMVPLSAYTKILSVAAQWDRAVDATAGVDFYTLYRNAAALTTVDEPDPLGADTSMRRSYTDSAVADGSTYAYRVSATDLAAPSHESAQSDAAATTVDATTPVTTLTLSPATPNGDNGWFKTAFGVTLTCVDATSSCNDAKYSINGGALTIYTGTFMIQTDGTYLITYSSTDNAGNAEAVQSRIVKLDQTKPVIAANSIPAATNNSSLTLSGTVTDATSGIGSFAINGTPVTVGAGGSYTHSVILNEGQNSFTEVARDVAGNTKLVLQEVVRDTVAPDTAITSAPAVLSIVADAVFEFTATEAGATFECSLDGVGFAACASPKTYTGLAEGSHNFRVRARDMAGNADVSPASHSWMVSLSKDRDNDGIENDIDMQPDIFSDAFTDGKTFGNITNRSGFTVRVGKTVDLRISADVSGASTGAAKIVSCGNNIETRYDVSESAALLCGANSTTIKANNGTIQWRKPPTGRGTRGDITAPDEYTVTGDPVVGANAANTAAGLVEVVDENDVALGSLQLPAGQTVDIDLSDSSGIVTFENLGTAPLAITMNGVALTLAPNESFSDQCPTVGGNVGGTGCPAADRNIVTRHTVNIGGGASTKAPLAGADVRVFDRNNVDFQLVAGSKNPDGSLYGVIYEADAGRVGACTTGSDGICVAGERVTGDLLVIVKFADAATGKTVYVGRPKSPTDFVDSNGDGVGDLATKELQIMKVFRKGVFEGYRGGDKTIVTGSMLEMIVPASGVWEGVRSLYPFVFNSDSDWAVDVCAQVPQGYSLVGAYDENGDLVASTQCVQTTVANQTKVIAFEVKEVASPEPSFVGTLKVTHKGKVTPVEVRVSDIRRASFDMKLKEARAKVGVSKVPVSRMERGDKTARLIKVGASLWSIVRDVFGLEGRDAEIVTLGKKIARLNAIRVPEWGIMEGRYDAEALPWGFALTLGGVEELRLAP